MFSITPLINSLLLFTNALLVRGLDASLTLADVRQAFYEANVCPYPASPYDRSESV